MRSDYNLYLQWKREIKKKMVKNPLNTKTRGIITEYISNTNKGDTVLIHLGTGTSAVVPQNKKLL